MEMIKEKAEAYDRAIKVAKDIRNGKATYIPNGTPVIDAIFPELKESEDEKIRKELIQYFSNFNLDTFAGLDPKKILAWLEKQGEKPQGKSALEAIKEEKVDNTNKVEPKDYSSIDPHFFKTIDKVEPKFKVGDWVIGRITENEPRQIAEITEEGYKTTYGGWIGFSFEEDMRLWNIQDAKEGDVLASKDGDNILIFRRIDSSTSFSSYYNIRGKGEFSWSNRCFIPATKEQRYKLEKAMADAGYTFDFDKKELKKIEDEEYNGEDYGIDGLWHAKNILEKTLGEVEGYQTDDGILDHKCAISAVNKLYKQKPSEWSEEDEEILENVISSINHDSIIEGLKLRGMSYSIESSEHLMKNLIDWLNSLKDRYTWKPSEEHIHWLKWAINRMPDTEKANEAEAVLKDLLEQLEEL